VTTADAHHHDHPPFLAHHFESPQQQFEAGKLGMWLFLATEVLLFGGLFCAYAIWRFHNPDMFRFGSTFLDTKMGAINTAVLIASSLTMATAVTLAQRNHKKGLIICLVLTLFGALGFLTIKYFEYSHKFHEGYFPGLRFYQQHDHAPTWDTSMPVVGTPLTAVDTTERALTVEELGLPDDITVEPSQVGPSAEASGGLNVGALSDAEREYRTGGGTTPGMDGAAEGHEDEGHEEDDHDGHGGGHGGVHPMQNPERPANAHMFFNIYFMMTGLHGVHVVIGGIVILWLTVKAIRGQFSDAYFTPVDLGGLYWHVVDLIWIFLFPLFYLI
jgi:cytochrome c oxidase subunit 3